MEAEIIPMCEDQGMAVVPWAALGGGLLLSAEQRRQREESLAGQKSFYDVGPKEIAIQDALEKIAVSKGTNVQAIVSFHSRIGSATSSEAPADVSQALAYLYHQTTYVIPIAGVQTIVHLRALADAATIRLSDEEVKSIQDAAPFDPLFPMNFLYSVKDRKGYSTKLTLADHVQYKMAAHLEAPVKASVSGLPIKINRIN
jgi:aryl-alcohol dehydrogenase-like predicted oxidoreductase